MSTYKTFTIIQNMKWKNYLKIWLRTVKNAQHAQGKQVNYPKTEGENINNLK